MWCGFISLDQFRFKEGDRGDPDFRSLLYGGRFLSYQECVGEAREDGLDREAMLMPSLSIGFPSFSVGGEGDKGEGVRIPGEPRGEEWE
ncbi:UNVERIFIED_CONTAM: hypothetical protein Sradi_7068500 [Sesamum radiatum]|uniref:Uncharacterized protein n=1 Tax=Sesamum radiatum TaxID=300843 RepID=A0AAW2J559_SESRA